MKKTGPRTILCDFGVHSEAQFRMFFEEKLFFLVAYFFFDFYVFLGRGRRQGQGPCKPQILQLASPKALVTPCDPFGVRRILWATPSAAGPRSLPIASGLQILGIVASASWHLWYANLSFGMIGCFTLACWGTLGQFWDIGEHNKQQNNTLRSRP